MGLIAANKKLIIIGLIFVIIVAIIGNTFGKISDDTANLIIIPIITGFFGLLKSDD